MVCLVCSSTWVQAQESTALLERTSRALFEAQNWEALVAMQPTLEANGMSYFAVHYRLGVAFFEQQEYYRALAEFQKAYRFDPASEALLRYLIPCYQFTEQFQAAATLDENAPHGLGWAYLENGYRFTDFSDSIQRMGYVQVALHHTVHPRLGFLHAYTGLLGGAWWGDYRQHQYFLKGAWYVGKGWTVHPFVHLIHLRAQPFVQTTYYLAGGALQKHWQRWEWQASVSQTDLGNRGPRYQWSLRADYHPWSSQKAKPFAELRQLAHRRQGQWQWRTGIRIQFSEAMRLQLAYFQGNAQNFHQENGYLVNNAIDPVARGGQVLFEVRTSKRFTFFGLVNANRQQEAFFNTNYNSVTLGWGLQLQL